MIQTYLIAGPTGSGKTDFSKLIAPLLNGIILSMDNYFFNLDELAKEYSDEYGEAPQCDSPSALDIELFISNFYQLFKNGQANIPGYDFISETRTAYSSLTKKENQPIIIDGVHAIRYKERIESLGVSTFSIFLNADENIRFERIKKRNIEERGDPEYLFDKQVHFIKLGEKKWILEQEKDADMVLDTTKGLTAKKIPQCDEPQVSLILSLIQQ
jgi:uridine kinase